MKDKFPILFAQFQEAFPKIHTNVLKKLLWTIKGRQDNFEFVGLSRYEHDKYGIGEATLQEIIYFLRSKGVIEYKKHRLRSKGLHNCNVYKIGNQFIELFKKLFFWTHDKTKEVDALTYISKFYCVKEKGKLYYFKVNGQKYIIHKTGRFMGKIYGTIENKIINPFSLIT